VVVAGEYTVSEALQVQVEQAADHVAVLIAVGDLDEATAGEFHGVAAALLARHGARGLNVLADLGGVRFCDSSGFNALLRVWRRVREEGGRFALSGPPEPVARLLALTGGDTFFTVYPTRDEGISALRS
jgi:anti-sigma B factor antagonist